MDLWTIIKVVFRRWYAVFPILAVSAFAAYQIGYKAPPTYQASGSALLVAPNVVTSPTGTVFKQNPYLLFSGSLNITASVVVRILNDPIERDSLIRAGLLGDYEVGADQSSPAIGITAEGDEPRVVVDTVGKLLDDVRTNVRNLQDSADAPADLRIGVEEVVRPTQALTVRGKVARTMATIGALGSLLAVGVALLMEAASAARKRSKAAAAAAKAAAEAPVVEPPPMPEAEESAGAAPVPAAPRRRSAARKARNSPGLEPVEPEPVEAEPAIPEPVTEAPAPRRRKRKETAPIEEPVVVDAAEPETVETVDGPAEPDDGPAEPDGGPAESVDGAVVPVEALAEPAAPEDEAPEPSTVVEVPAPRGRKRKRTPVPEVVTQNGASAAGEEVVAAPPPSEPKPRRRRRGRRSVPASTPDGDGASVSPDAVDAEAAVQVD